ncbi:MAG: hypothetical protein R3E50_14445 [Halioglobus sp.]
MLALKPGDRVADIWGGGGYYSELMASVVGETGEVLLVNNLVYSQYAGRPWPGGNRAAISGPAP